MHQENHQQPNQKIILDISDSLNTQCSAQCFITSSLLFLTVFMYRKKIMHVDSVSGKQSNTFDSVTVDGNVKNGVSSVQ